MANCKQPFLCKFGFLHSHTIEHSVSLQIAPLQPPVSLAFLILVPVLVVECSPGVQNTAIVENHRIPFLQGILICVGRVVEQCGKLLESRIECNRCRNGQRGLKGRRVVDVLDLWGVGRPLREKR